MNDLQQYQIKQSCKLALPNGLQELMSDISREVLRYQPKNLCNFIAEYLGALLEARDKLAIAAEVYDEVCHGSCQPELEDELKDMGLSDEEVTLIGKIVQKYFEERQCEKEHETLQYELSKKIDVEETVLQAVVEAVLIAFRRHFVNNAAAVKYAINSSENDTDDSAIKAAKNTMNVYKSDMSRFTDSEIEEPEENKCDKYEEGWTNKDIEEEPLNYMNIASGSVGSYMTESKQELYVDESTVEEHTLNCQKDTPQDISEIKREVHATQKIIAKLMTVSSMSLAGSHVVLPKHAPYAANQCCTHKLSIVDETPEREQLNLDYTTTDKKKDQEN